MGKKATDDEMHVPDTPRSTKNRKQLSALDLTPNSGARSVDSRDAVSPRSVGKSPRGGKNSKLDFNSVASVKGAGNGGGSPTHNGDGDPEYVNADITADELRQIEQVLKTSEPRLQELYKKVSESSFKDHAAVFENLHWDILKETGYMSWFGLAFTLAGYLSYHCQAEAKSAAGEKWSSLRSETDFIIDQLDELKLCLEVDNDMFKIAAGTLLYCCAAVRLLKKKNRGCLCFVSRNSVVPVKEQIENSIAELKSLQKNITFATLAAVGNRVSQPVTDGGSSVKRSGPENWTASVGLEQHVATVCEFVKNKGISLIGIHGQAGLGKTTLLNEIVAKIEKEEKRLFAYIEVGEDLKKLQSSLLEQLGGGKKEITSAAQGRSALLAQLRKLKENNKVARIAIDNLYDVRLVGEFFPHSLGKFLPANSCVIITCPSVAILSKVDALCRPAMPNYHYLPYKLPCLAPQQAKALFISHAASEPVNTLYSINGIFSKYGDLANHFLPLCEGLPMALKVVGSYFSNPANRSEENWLAIGKRMKQVAEEMDTSEDQMFAKLLVIYEKLGPAQKEAFLDIAAFLRGWDWRTVERVVGKPQLDTLVDQAMVSAKLKDAESTSGISLYTRYSDRPWKSEMVMMHELLYAIACRRAAGNRVCSEDQAHLPERLKMDGPGMELSALQGLSLISCKEPLQGTMLEKMQGARILILHDTGVKGYCTKPLNQLQFLYWGRSRVAPDVRIPFQMERLKRLEMCILRAAEIDLTIKFPSQLKDLTLIGCNNMDVLHEHILQLTGLLELHLIGCNKLHDLTADFAEMRGLRKFRLENCLSIRHLHKSIGQLASIRELDLSGCTNIATLPSEIGNIQTLLKLNLVLCKCLVRLPAEIGNLKNLTHLYLGQSGITSLPVEIGKLRSLEDLSLTGCVRLEKLPPQIGQLTSLLRLNLGSCTGIKELPSEVGGMTNLQKLVLNSCTALPRLPEELFELVNLQSLELDYMKLLAHLPAEIGNLSSLQRLSLNCCTRLNRLPPEIGSLPALQVLNLVGCTGLKPELPMEIQKLAKENAVYVHREDDHIILEGPDNPSYKLYSMTY